MLFSAKLKKFFLQRKQNRKITRFDITIFIRQFSALLTAGIPILQCCEILEKSQIKTSLRILIYSIKRELLSGKDFYTSLHPHAKYFDEITRQLIKIGEHTGKLDMTLNRLADEHEKQLAFNTRMKHILFYPCIIIIASIIVTLSMFLFVVPRFAELFASTKVQLPLFTQLIFFLSAKLQQYFYICVLLLIIIIIILTNKKTRQLKKVLYATLTQLPFIYQIMQKIILARFARNLALTFSAGIPISQALKLTMHHSPHLEFTHSLIKLRSQINSGLQLHQAMQSLTYFPDFMIQMTKIGEESGLLDHLMSKIASFFESEIDIFLNQLTRLLEPLIMLVLGALIGGLVIGLYLPIFKLGNAL